MNAIKFGCVAIALLTATSLSVAQEPSSRQKREVRLIARRIDRAGRLYQAKKYESAAEEIAEAQDSLLALAASADSPLMQLIQPHYDRLSNAHRLLKEQGFEIEQLKPLPEPLSADAARVSFREQIAPLIVTQCGRCHVDQSSGEFSALNYNLLMASQHVVPGRPDLSRMLAVIENGEMPPDGELPEPAQGVLKLWIRQGAEFDGGNPNTRLKQLAGNISPTDRGRKRTQMNRPSGNETVSFGRDIAPLLLENCNGCHLGGRRFRGNFNMNNFDRFLRGGDGGPPIEPGAPSQSLILKRLRGSEAEVMPPDGKLSDEKIALVERWIAEGGTFDGDSPQTALATVASVAAAKAQDHQALSRARDQLSIKNWKLIMSDIDPETHANGEFRVIGTNAGDRLQATVKLASEQGEQIEKYLQSEPDQPFVKGKATIYLFERRYELNELGLMLVGRAIPKEQTGRWDYTPVDAYASLLLPRGEALNGIRAELTQQLAAIHVAAMADDIPRWFADGVGYLTAASILGKDRQLQSWQKEADAIINSLDQPFAFATGQLNELDAGLAGYAFVQHLKKSGDLNRLMKLIRDGNAFNDAFAAVFGAQPGEFFENRGRKRGR